MNEPNQLRVAFLNTSMVVGGQERVLLDVVNGLNRKRFKPYVLLTKSPGPLASRFKKDVPIQHGLRKFKGDPCTLWRMWRWMRKHRPQIVWDAQTNWGKYNKPRGLLPRTCEFH